MIRVTIEILPGGDASAAYTIADATIARIGGNARVGCYEAAVVEDACAQDGLPEWQGRTTLHHKAGDGAVGLVGRALSLLVSERIR